MWERGIRNSGGLEIIVGGGVKGAQEARRVAGNDGVGRDIAGDNRSGADYGVLPYRHTGEDGGSGTNPGSATDAHGSQGDDLAVAQVMVVGENLRIGGNLHIVLNGDATGTH